jgi:hypothetical protein
MTWNWNNDEAIILPATTRNTVSEEWLRVVKYKCLCSKIFWNIQKCLFLQ